MAEKPNAYRNLLGINKASFTLAVIAFILSIVDLGFRLEYRTDQFFLFIYHLAIALCLTSLLARIYIKRNNQVHSSG